MTSLNSKTILCLLLRQHPKQKTKDSSEDKLSARFFLDFVLELVDNGYLEYLSSPAFSHGFRWTESELQHRHHYRKNLTFGFVRIKEEHYMTGETT